MVIADQLAQYVNVIFSDPSQYTGSMLVIAAVLFALQIYCDFSGYSDIAIGTARLFGFDLKQNFAFPYFSRNIGEFWRRWHISLSTWFRDYLYIPLGGSRGGKWLSIRNVFIIFLVSGFWHGANWTFIAWGGLNALYFLPLLLTNNNRNYLDTVATGKYFPSLKEFTNIALTFALTVFAWIFFRAENMTHALEYIGGIFEQSLFMLPQYKGFKTPFLTLGTIFLLILIEWLGRENKHALEKLLLTRARFVRWAFYLFLLFLVRFFAHTKAMDFIYFQF
jgi:D-alanyl-lipoteichoic acid acyltransferase DltB (MBOAT superfamily)